MYNSVAPRWATPETVRLAEVLNSVLSWWTENGRDHHCVHCRYPLPDLADVGSVRAVIEQILTDGLDDRSLIIARVHIGDLDQVDWQQVAERFGSCLRV